MNKFCGKNFTVNDIESIRSLINNNPTATRARLSRLVCELFEWRRHDNKLKEMSCRVAMLKMYREGLIELPAPKCAAPPAYKPTQSVFCDPVPDLYNTVNDCQNLRVELVAKGKDLRHWNEYMARYHYLGYKMLPGAQLRYFILDNDRILGAMGWGAAAWKVAPRDLFIDWDPEQREKQLHLIVNQSRFLIFPWIHCKNLASKSLAMVAKRISNDWGKSYGYRPVLMETFVENNRFLGTCYKADNWDYVGNTQGRGKLDRFKQKNSPIKSIWLKSLTKNFRSVLQGKT